MENSTGMGKTAGLAGSVICAAGVIAFFVGMFGGPKMLVIVGSVLMAVSLIGFFIEEQSNRRHS